MGDLKVVAEVEMQHNEHACMVSRLDCVYEFNPVTHTPLLCGLSRWQCCIDNAALSMSTL